MTQFRRLGPAGAERPVIEVDGTVYDLSPLTADIDGDFLAEDGLARGGSAARAGEPPVVSEEGSRVGPPVGRPNAILCIGQNYAAHAAESGSPVPEYPILFLKHPNTIVGPHDDVRLPPGAARGDWEVELAVVIGEKTWECATDEEALAHVAGYAVGNDVSERAVRRLRRAVVHRQDLPDLLPTRPRVGTRGRGRPQRLRLRSWVNGEPRQDSSTKDMIFPVAALVRALSHRMLLEPGDVVLTGTPEGVALSGRFPYLAPGDVMEMEIEGLGRQRQHVR